MRENEQKAEKRGRLKQEWIPLDCYLKIAYRYVGIPPQTELVRWGTTRHLKVNYNLFEVQICVRKCMSIQNGKKKKTFNCE